MIGFLLTGDVAEICAVIDIEPWHLVETDYGVE
jgi:hypothetical protein